MLGLSKNQEGNFIVYALVNGEIKEAETTEESLNHLFGDIVDDREKIIKRCEEKGWKNWELTFKKK